MRTVYPESLRLLPYPALTPVTPMPAFHLSENINGSSNWLIMIGDKDKYFPDPTNNFMMY